MVDTLTKKTEFLLAKQVNTFTYMPLSDVSPTSPPPSTTMVVITILNMVTILTSILYTWFKQCPHGHSCSFLEDMHKSSPKIIPKSGSAGLLCTPVLLNIAMVIQCGYSNLYSHWPIKSSYGSTCINTSLPDILIVSYQRV